MAEEDRASARPRRSAATWVRYMIIVLLVACCAYWYVRYRQAVSSHSGGITQAAQLAEKLSRSIALPNEEPGMTTVLDHAKLGDPQLVREAKNNDQLLVYARAKRVILYRPSTGKVIDMFHVVPGGGSVRQTP